MPALRAMLERSGWEKNFIAGMEQSALELRARPRAAALAAVDGDSLAGFCLVEHYGWNNLAQIQGLAVDPDRRRQRIATTLVSAAEAWALAAAARGIYVDTPVENRGGCAFYRAVGYVEAYIMPRYYADDLDGITFQKFF